MEIHKVYPTNNRLKAVENAIYKYKFNGRYVYYNECGMGAEILNDDGSLMADFVNHLDAEKFLFFLDKEKVNVNQR